MNTNPAHFTKWVALQVIWLTALYFGTYAGNVHAMRVFTFVAWLNFIGSVLVATSIGLAGTKSSPEEIDASTRKTIEQARYRVLPQWVDGLYDVAVACVLVYYGHIVLGIITILAQGLQAGAKDTAEKLVLFEVDKTSA